MRRLKELVNFCPVHGYDTELRQRYQTVKGLTDDVGIDGIELLTYENFTQEELNFYGPSSLGVHLQYWTFWVDFWRGDQAAVQEQFPHAAAKKAYYGAETAAEWLEVIRKNILLGLACHPQYLVCHVGEVSNAESFTMDYKYTDTEVIDAFLEIANQVVDLIPSNVYLLFENLWWSGLRLDKPELVERLLSGVKHDKVGLMLDTGHLANTNKNLVTEKDLVVYEKQVLEQLGSLKKYIRGMHLNCSLSGKYLQTFPRPVPKKMTAHSLFENIISMDRHQPFTDGCIRELTDLAAPDYIVHELYYDDLTDLKKKVGRQRKALLG